MKKLFFLLLFCLLTTGGANAKAQDLGDLFGGKGLEGILDGLSKDDETNIVSMIFLLEHLATTDSPVFDFSKYINCSYVLCKYIELYVALAEDVNSTDDCNEKYGIYVAMEAWLLGTINLYYCVEDVLDLLSNPEKKEERNEFQAELNYLAEVGRRYKSKNANHKNTVLDKIFLDMVNTLDVYDRYHPETGTHYPSNLWQLKLILDHGFNPKYTIPLALDIAGRIEALPCDGG